MLNENEFLRELGKNSDRIKKISKPLEKWGVSYFYYYEMNNDGNAITLSSRPEIDEYYLKEKLYLNDPFVRHPDHFQSRFFLFDLPQNPELDQAVADTICNFSLFPLICYCKKNQEGAEFLGFWGDAKRAPSFEYVYLNHPNLLKSFSSYFKDECKSILRKKESKSMSFRNLLGADIFDFKAPPFLDAEKSIRTYLIDLGMGGLLIKFDSLSRRERQCLQLMLRGKSSKDIGLDLKLSPRTIEFYFENIRNKLDCHSKSELFSIAENFRYLNLLD